MAQGLDTKSWDGDKSPSTDSKGAEGAKRSRGAGSRRIFPPRFKLQVLDSYRNDADCRGNQRATARKYNIHRRQIQKWLQCEQNLRTSVEESEAAEGRRGRKKAEERTEATSNRSAAGFGRPGDAGGAREARAMPRREDEVVRAEESGLEARNLKRAAQKLYPSLHGMPCAEREKVAHPSAGVEGRKSCGSDAGRAVGVLAEPRDDDLVRTEDRPLDLKSKVRSDASAEEFSAEDEASAGKEGEDSSELPPTEENVGGQKLSAPDAALRCLVRKYADDVEGRESRGGEPDDGGLLFSRGASRAESSRLSDIRVPKNPESEPRSAASSGGRDSNEGERTAGAAEPDFHADARGPEKAETDRGRRSKFWNRFDCSKSFSPKRKWMEESMQEMLEDSEPSHDASSLPIKQRVKMNLRALPEAARDRPAPLSSNFTIERLCADDAAAAAAAEEVGAPDCYAWCAPCRLPPPALTIPAHRVFPDLLSLRLRPCGPDLRVPLKEEKVSDGEDADVDVLSTTPVEKKSFDFSGYNFGKRRSFSVQFKLTVLDAFYNDKDCNKNQRATARKFNINRRQVQKWLSQESELRSEGSVKNGKYLQRQRLGGDLREGEPCARCPRHCLRKRPRLEPFAKTIEVNLQPCSDDECLSRGGDFRPGGIEATSADDLDFYGKSFFRSDLKSGNFYHGYLFPDNSNLIYPDSVIGWPNVNASALAVPDFQYLSTWHHNFDFCAENQKIY